MKSLVKVWPLRPGVPGCDALGNPVALTPGLAGWMESEDAKQAQEADEVQIMAGLRPKDLRPPVESAAMSAEKSAKSAAPKKRTYRRRDMHAEKPAAE